MIKIDFEQETRHGTYRDAITLPDDHTFTQEQIEAMKQQRVDNWVAYMDNPPQPEPEPEPEYIEIDGVKYLKAE
jgi:hypothetical protein